MAFGSKPVRPAASHRADGLLASNTVSKSAASHGENTKICPGLTGTRVPRTNKSAASTTTVLPSMLCPVGSLLFAAAIEPHKHSRNCCMALAWLLFSVHPMLPRADITDAAPGGVPKCTTHFWPRGTRPCCGTNWWFVIRPPGQ